MNLILRRREAADALARVRLSEREWADQTRVLRACAARHRAGLIVGGGFAAGLVTSLVPIAPLLRLGTAFASTLSLMLQGPLSRLFTEQRDERGERSREEESSQ